MVASDLVTPARRLLDHFALFPVGQVLGNDEERCGNPALLKEVQGLPQSRCKKGIAL
jgi:hypothetical protein